MAKIYTICFTILNDFTYHFTLPYIDICGHFNAGKIQMTIDDVVTMAMDLGSGN